MNITRRQIGNSIFWIIIILMIIPQTRKEIQLVLNKGLALFSPGTIDDEDQTKLKDYQWTLVDESGHNFNFNNTKNKVVLINFWATWCPPCIAEMPSLELLYQKFKDNPDVVFLFVTSEENSKSVAFKQKHHYSFPVYRPQTSYPDELNHSSIPTTYVIDKLGNIVIEKSGAANWNSEKTVGLIQSLISK